MFTSHEKVVMKELVQILEPFEEATDLTHAGRSICLVHGLVIPSVVGLQKHLHQVEVHYLLSVVIKLKTALDNRLGDVVGDWH